MTPGHHDVRIHLKNYLLVSENLEISKEKAEPPTVVIDVNHNLTELEKEEKHSSEIPILIPSQPKDASAETKDVECSPEAASENSFRRRRRPPGSQNLETLPTMTKKYLKEVWKPQWRLMGF